MGIKKKKSNTNPAAKKKTAKARPSTEDKDSKTITVTSKKGSKTQAAAKKKTTTKTRKRKATMKTKVEKPLTPEEIEEFRQLLWEKRRELLGDVDHMREKTLEGNRQESAGELSSMPIHMADVGTDNYEQEFTLGLIESERKVLKEIDLALNKIKQDKYGICEITGQTIGRARLTAKPEARYHIEIARKIELGLIDLPEANNSNSVKVKENKG